MYIYIHNMIETYMNIGLHRVTHLAEHNITCYKMK